MLKREIKITYNNREINDEHIYKDSQFHSTNIVRRHIQILQEGICMNDQKRKPKKVLISLKYKKIITTSCNHYYQW